MIEILIIASIFFIIARMRISRRGTSTQEILTISIAITQRSEFRYERKTSRRSGRISTHAGIANRRNSRRR